MRVYSGGTFTMGTEGPRVPSTSTAVLEFDCSSAGDSGCVCDAATIETAGYDKQNLRQVLTADAAASQAELTVGDTDAWAANDELVITSTTRTDTETEKKTIQTVDDSETVTLTGNLSYAHAGTTAPVIAEVFNLTQNVKIRGVSSSLPGYLNWEAGTATITMHNTECYWLGVNSSGKFGIQVGPTTGSFGSSARAHVNIHMQMIRWTGS